MADMAGPILEARGLVKHFRTGGGLFQKATVIRAVDGVSFAVARGETLAIVGESGCGKSTVGRLLLRLLDPTAGTVRFEGSDLGDRDAVRIFQEQVLGSHDS